MEDEKTLATAAQNNTEPGKPADAAPSTDGTTPPADAAPPAAGETTPPAAAGTAPQEPSKETVLKEYTDFKAPKGFELNKDLMAKFLPMAKESGLTQDAAQKFIDLYAATELADSEGSEAKRLEADKTAFTTQNETWQAQTKSDPEIGGAKFEESMQHVAVARDAFGNDALMALLNTTGIGNNVEVLRFMAKAGKAISSDKFVGGGSGGGEKTYKQTKDVLPQGEFK